MSIVITGATGFIGKHLCKSFVASGHKVVALTRNTKSAESILGQQVECVYWDGKNTGEWQKHIDGAKAVINLAGANLAGSLWTDNYKQKILASRINAGNAIVSAIKNSEKKPTVLLQGSAIGIYGNRGEEALNETSATGSGFLADVVEQWEASVKSVETETRVVYLRTGIVLGKGEGTLAKMELPFKLFAGGPPGNGKQWFSWIHIQDVINAIQLLVENPKLDGAFNLTAPNPSRMEDFSKALGKVLNRPSWLPVPAIALKLLLGEMARETVLASQNVLPKKLLENDYQFLFPDLNPALSDLYE